MYIVAIAWIYVVLMMSITETSAVAGIMTFMLYGVAPLTIILYLTGGKQRRRKRALIKKSSIDSHRSEPIHESANGVDIQNLSEHKKV
jgi:hypothetical protein